MKIESLMHVPAAELLEMAVAASARARASRAESLAQLAEADARQLYRPEGCRSMYGYCVEHRLMDEDELPMLLEAARTALRFPAIFDAIAEGRLHEESVALLAPHLSPHTAGELLAAASGKQPGEIEALLDERFPDRERHGRLRPVAPAWDTGMQGALETWAADPATYDLPMPTRWYEFKAVVTPATRDKLLQAKAVLGDDVPPGNLAAALDRLLTIYLAEHA